LARFRKPKIVENKRQKTKKKEEHKRGRKKKKRRDKENPRQLLLRINTPLKYHFEHSKGKKPNRMQTSSLIQ
jgi:hypothetical protein